MTQIIIETEDCTKCPHFTSKRIYTADSWENIMEWKCNKKNQIIDWYHETFDKTPIPEWCPITLKKKMYRAKLFFTSNQ